FLVYDRIAAVNPSQPVEWHLHSKNPIAIHGSSYTFDNGRYGLYGQLVVPATGVRLERVPVNQGPKSSRSSERLDIIVNDRQAVSHLLNVLQVSRIGVPVSTAHQVTPYKGDAQGVLVAGWVVM